MNNIVNELTLVLRIHHSRLITHIDKTKLKSRPTASLVMPITNDLNYIVHAKDGVTWYTLMYCSDKTCPWDVYIISIICGLF